MESRVPDQESVRGFCIIKYDAEYGVGEIKEIK